jgi:hypothetical protein
MNAAAEDAAAFTRLQAARARERPRPPGAAMMRERPWIAVPPRVRA